MKVLVVLIQLVILMTNIPMLLSTLKYSLTMLDSLLVVSCINRLTDIATNPIGDKSHKLQIPKAINPIISDNPHNVTNPISDQHRNATNPLSDQPFKINAADPISDRPHKRRQFP